MNSHDKQLNLIERYRKSIVCSIAGLEISTLSQLQSELIIDGIPPKGMTLDQIDVVRNVNKGIDQLVQTKNEELNLTWLKNMNYLIWKSQFSGIRPGSLRTDTVRITNTSYVPPVPTPESVKALFKTFNANEDIYMKATEVLIELSKAQLFNDCNKRTALLAANKVLFDNNAGVIEIGIDQREEYVTRLVKFYEDKTNKSKEEFQEWLIDNCIYNTSDKQLDKNRIWILTDDTDKNDDWDIDEGPTEE